MHEACIVIAKQPPPAPENSALKRLAELNQQAPGMSTRAFRELAEMMPRVDGKPALVGPYDEMNATAQTIRTIGYRKMTAEPPIIHAKLALLGNIWWSDDHPSGYTVDMYGFVPKRLWISSANFTFASRRSLEFGFWSEDEQLMAGAKRFLLKLIANSEELDPDADEMDPELTEIEFDDEAMAEALNPDQRLRERGPSVALFPSAKSEYHHAHNDDQGDVDRRAIDKGLDQPIRTHPRCNEDSDQCGHKQGRPVAGPPDKQRYQNDGNGYERALAQCERGEDRDQDDNDRGAPTTENGNAVIGLGIHHGGHWKLDTCTYPVSRHAVFPSSYRDTPQRARITSLRGTGARSY